MGPLHGLGFRFRHNNDFERLTCLTGGYEGMDG